MARIIHFSDLHLSETEKQYGFRVLEEIQAHIYREQAEIVLIAGDLFDSLEDVHALLPEVRSILDSWGGRVVYLPGNHEVLNRGKGLLSLNHLSPGETTLLSGSPIDIRIIETENAEKIEVIGIAHAQEYTDLMQLDIPARNSSRGFIPRIVMAHATVVELVSYTGPSSEEGAGMLDARTFEKWEADYVALGHIHRSGIRKFGNTILSYPGSSRVWRKGESEPRKIVFYDTNEPTTWREIPLDSAGVHREISVPATFEGKIDAELSAIQGNAQDRLTIRFTGVVENQNTFETNRDAFVQELQKTFRLVDEDSRDVLYAKGLKENPLVASFLKQWSEESSRPEDSLLSPYKNEDPQSWQKEVHRRSRELALKSFKEIAGKK